MPAGGLVGYFGYDTIRYIEKRLAATRSGAVAGLFRPPFTTLHSGMIKGGTAHNITAADCELVMEFRVVPGESVDGWAARFEAECARVEAAMQAIRPEAAILLERARAGVAGGRRVVAACRLSLAPRR